MNDTYFMKLTILFIFTVFPLFSAAQIPKKQNGVTGSVYRYAAFPSAITDARNVDVWLPPNYSENQNEKYPVIYMHDGQNLFDSKTSQSKDRMGN